MATKNTGGFIRSPFRIVQGEWCNDAQKKSGCSLVCIFYYIKLKYMKSRKFEEKGVISGTLIKAPCCEYFIFMTIKLVLLSIFPKF